MTAIIVSISSVPTREGRRRYPSTDGYFPDISSEVMEPDTSLPCRCTEKCHPRCGGDCGCRACGLSFTIWADESGYLGTGEPVLTEGEQLRIYRGEA
jgi:hypothetical protein